MFVATIGETLLHLIYQIEDNSACIDLQGLPHVEIQLTEILEVQCLLFRISYAMRQQKSNPL